MYVERLTAPGVLNAPKIPEHIAVGADAEKMQDIAHAILLAGAANCGIRNEPDKHIAAASFPARRGGLMWLYGRGESHLEAMINLHARVKQHVKCRRK